MSTFKKKLKTKLTRSAISLPFELATNVVMEVEYQFYRCIWYLRGYRLPSVEERRAVAENCTFFYKSFQRQRLAKRLCRNIRRYYPDVKIVIADDSRKPLIINDSKVEVVQLPFNQGLSYGLNRALERITTPFAIRMDDDELLTPLTNIGRQLALLQTHPEVDLASILYFNAPQCRNMRYEIKQYLKQPMDMAPLPLKIHHATRIDDKHVVLGKASNCFVCRTDKLKAIGYDDNIRMMDHNEFFFRAAGNIVSVVDEEAFVFHRHNIFNHNYNKYRLDIQQDYSYIHWKHYVKAAKTDEKNL